ncbi:MAG: murein L,D-transpeptidase [Hyphomicrobiaceae bacterium]
MRRNQIAAATATCAILSLCGPAGAMEPDPPKTLLTIEEGVAFGVREQLQAPAGNLTDGDRSDRQALAAYYVTRANKPIWIDGDTLTAKAKAVVEEIRRADDWGLTASDFELPAADMDKASGHSSLVDAEAKISLAVLKYARFARGGRIPDPRQMSSYLDRDPQLISPVKILEQITATSDPGGYLAGLHPKHAGFQKLRQKLLEMRKSEIQEAAPVMMPASGPLLREGTRHPDVAILRQRLELPPPEAGEDGTADPELFDTALLDAVKAYQRENGMSADGIIGNRTRAALNGGKRSIDEAFLIANMEEWRWMPDDLGKVYVWVNLPDYKFQVIKDSHVIHEERVIIGQANKQTPVFSHAMETVVLHPFWGVPNSIKVNELLPSLARGSSLQRRGLRLQYNGRDVDPLSVDWSRSDIRNFHVYQPPGRSNVLGEVKFMFPNKHQVYMHDTPTKNLFNQSKRTFSHGCVRVRNPMRLAEIILAEDKGWQASKVHSMLQNGPDNQEIRLESKIPVHVTYFTAFVDETGELQTRPDVYQHEKRIRLALAGEWNRIPRHRDHLLPVPYVKPKIQTYSNNNNGFSSFFESVFGGF